MTARLDRVLRTRTAMAAWVGLWVVAGVSVAVAWLPPTGGATLTRRSEAGVTIVPASIRLLRMTASETTVEVTVLGRPDLTRVVDSGLATLTDSAGNEHFIRQGSIAGRSLTVSFDGSTSVTSGRARIDFPRVGLTSSPIQTTADDEHVTYVALELLFELAPTGGSAQTASPNLSAVAEGGYGATVTSIVRDDEGAVISGRLDGFTREEIQSLSLQGTQVVLADGSSALFTGGSYGEGDGLADFSVSIRVSRQAELAWLELHIDAVVPPMVRIEANAETRARLDRFEARDAFVLTIELER